MNLQLFSPLTLVSGLAAIAGGLYLLQRLRVRHREVDVVTTLFWREAVEDTQARVLKKRFRHLAAYLLALTIAALAWIAMGEPRLTPAGDREVLLLLDASAASGRGGRFQRSVDALLQEVERHDPAVRSVVLCGARPRALLAPGDRSLLLPRRLEGVAPEACSSTVAAVVRRHCRNRPVAGAQLSIRIFGGTMPADLLALASNVEIAAWQDPVAAGAEPGIRALGLSPAISGRWDRVDVLVEVASSDNSVAPPLTIDGRPVSVVPERVPPAWIYRDLRADGGLLASLNPDGQAGLLRLPLRRSIGVRVVDGLDPALDLALDAVFAADPAVDSRSSSPSVAVALADQPGLPTLVIVPGSRELVVVDGTDPQNPNLSAALDCVAKLADFGLDTVDPVIAVRAEAAAVRGFRLGEKLLRDPAFLASRRLPLVVGCAVRYLAGIEDPPPEVVVGRPLSRADWHEVRDGNGDPLLSVGPIFTPPVAGVYTVGSNRLLQATVLDDEGVASAVESEDPVLAASSTPDLVTLLLLLTLVLVAVEWSLYRMGRMP